MTGPATAVALTEAGESQSRERRLGLLLGFLGVAAFSLSLPVTRRAVQEIDATFVAFGRMALAGLAPALLLALRPPRFPPPPPPARLPRAPRPAGPGDGRRRGRARLPAVLDTRDARGRRLPRRG